MKFLIAYTLIILSIVLELSFAKNGLIEFNKLIVGSLSRKKGLDVFSDPSVLFIEFEEIWDIS